MSDQAQGANVETKTFSEDYVKELRGEAASWRTKVREMEEKLNSLTSAQEAAAKAEAEKRGEFENLYKTAQQEREELVKKVKEQEEVVKSYLERDKAEFDGLLEKVPEKLRGHLDESIPLAKRIALAKELSAQVAAPPKAGLPGETPATTYAEEIKNAKTTAELNAVLAKHGKT